MEEKVVVIPTKEKPPQREEEATKVKISDYIYGKNSNWGRVGGFKS